MSKQPVMVYVAGPISKGDQFVNCRDAVLVGERLRKAGLFPFVPHLSAVWQMISPIGYEDWMAYDFAWILRCDAVLRIPGESSGANREVCFAASNDIPVFFSELDLLAWAGVPSVLT